jgi:hypothetical protein
LLGSFTATAQTNPTTNVLAASPNPLAPGAVATLTATVEVNLAPVAGGTVTFLEGKRVLGTAQVVANGTAAGTAVIKTRSFQPGQHSLTAVYGGAPNGSQKAAGSTSAAVVLAVQGQVPSTISLLERIDRATPGTYDLTTIVTGTGLQAAPTGAVTFSNGSTTLGSARLGAAEINQGFASTPTLYSAPNVIEQFVAADFNNDGIPDLAGILHNVSGLVEFPGNASNPGTFLTAISFQTSAPATSIVAGDFNNDGWTDLAVLHASTVGVFLADPSHPGQFLAEQTFSAPNNPIGLVLADFNGDGMLDLAIANNTGSTVGVLLGNPSNPGTFMPEVDYKIAGNPTTIAVGDFNGDSIPDVVVAATPYASDQSNNQIEVLFGDPSHPGTFLTARVVSYSPVSGPLAVADFNHDGVQDIVFSSLENGPATALSLLPGDPTHPGQFLSVVSNLFVLNFDGVTALTTADFNNDGLPDLAIITQKSAAYILLNEASTPGQFQDGFSFTSQYGLSAVLGVDLNGDEIADLVLGNPYPSGAGVILSSFSGSATATLTGITLPAGAQSLGASYSGDNNFSGSTPVSFSASIAEPTTTTLAISSPGIVVKGTAITLTSTVALNGQAVTAGRVKFLDGKRFLGAAQVSSSGIAFLKTSSFNPGAHSLTAVFEGAAHAALGNLAPSVSSAVGLTITGQPGSGAALTATTRDKNLVNDNFTAIVGAFGLTSPTGTVAVQDTTSNTTLATGTLSSSNAGIGYLPAVSFKGPNSPGYGGAVITADFNGDGIPDVGAVDYVNNVLDIFLGDPNHPGQFIQGMSVTLPPNSAYGGDLIIADFNGDGIPDIAFLAPDASNALQILLGDPANPGQFKPAIGYSFPTSEEALNLAVGDLNGDGLPDLIVGGSNITIFLNNPASPGQFLAPSQTGLESYSSLFIADLNGDGVRDIITENTYLPGDPANPGQFLPGVSLNLGSSEEIEAVADINGDGLPDMVAVSGQLLQILLNSPTNPGQFIPNTPAALNGVRPSQVIAADVNGDGVIDLIVGVEYVSLPGYVSPQFGLQVFLGDTSNPGQFIAQPVLPYLDLSWHAIADFNGDGLLDVATLNPIAVDISLAANIASGYFADTPVPTPGPNVLNASYAGDSIYLSSVSPAIAINVPVSSTTVLSASPLSALLGTTITLTATVTISGNPAATGTVQFRDGTSILGSAQIIGSGSQGGSAIFETKLGVGAHTLTAVYSGAPLSNQYDNGSSSAPVTVTINGTPNTATWLSVAGSSPGKYNLTAAVSTFNQAVPAGSVTFRDLAQHVTLGELPLPSTSAWGFASPVLTPVSQSLYGATFTAGDLNGDSVPDLVVTNGGLLLLLSDPQNPGKFQRQISIATAETATGVAIADVNGDGVPDLITCEGTTAPQGLAGLVEIFLGIPNSPGHFATPAQYKLSSGRVSGAIRVADLNRDGIPDIAVLTSPLLQVTIFEGNPNQPGTFVQTGQVGGGLDTSDSGYGQVQLQIADLNNDGLPDLLTGVGSVNVVLNNSDSPGAFLSANKIGTGSFVVTADFNGDGIPDIAYADVGNVVTVLLSVAGQPGTFQSAVTYSAGNGITGLVAGDFNRDGHSDLAVANATDTTISVLTNDGTHPGQFLPQVVYPTAASPTYLATADMNGDGFPDLVALDRAGNVEVLLSGLESSVVLSNIALPGSGYHNLQAAFRPVNNRFAAPLGASNSNIVQIVLPSTPTVSLSANPITVALGNVVTLIATVTVDSETTQNVRGGLVEFFDGPRSLGTAQVVISGTAQGTATLRTASFGPGTHTITANFGGALRGPIPALAAASAPASITITGLVASTTSLTVNPDPSNNANSAFQATVLGFAPNPPMGPVNFVNNTASATMGSIPLSGSPSFSCGPALISPFNLNIGYHAWVSGDFNNDGILDLAVLSPPGVLGVAFGDPNHPGQFLPETDYNLNQSITVPTMVAADFNGDGVLDLAIGTVGGTTGPTSATTQVFLGEPAHPGQFQSPITMPLGGEFGQLVTADFNADGLPDLAYFDPTFHALTVALADPAHPGQFLPGIVTSLPGGYQQIAIADMNHDGFPDLVLTSGSQPSGLNLLVMIADLKNPGQFAASTSISLGSGVSSVNVADFNEDGLPDVLSIQNSKLVLYANDPSNPGNFLPPAPAAAKPLSATIYGNVVSASAYDMNGDGLVDLVLWNTSSSWVSLNDAANPGHFLNPTSTNTISFVTGALIGDFNSDGLPDLLEVGRTDSTVVVYPGGLSLTANLDKIALPAPNQSVVAEYSGDSDYQLSTSNTVTAPWPRPIDTYLYFGPLPNTVYTGATLVVNTVAVGQGDLPMSSGSITFTLTDPAFNNTSLGTLPVNSAGYASIPITVFTPGRYFLSAAYSGTSVWAPTTQGLTIDVLANSAPAALHATPNPILVPTGSTTGSTSLSWTAPGATTTEVHTNSPSGPLVASGGSSNAEVAVSSVSDGTIFYLQDTSNGKALTLPNTLDTVMVHVRTAPVFSATPNPMILGGGMLTGTTLLQWNAPAGITTVEIHQGSFNGPLIGGGGATGSAAALGIAPGTVFYLQNTTGGQSLSAAGTLGILTVQ